MKKLIFMAIAATFALTALTGCPPAATTTTSTGGATK